MKTIIHEDRGGSTGGTPVIQMNAVPYGSQKRSTIKHIIDPNTKSNLVTEALNYINENALLDQLVAPELEQQYEQKFSQAKELSKYNVVEAKEHINKVFKHDPNLSKQVIKQVKSIEEVSVLGTIRQNITNKNLENMSKNPSITKTGNLISTHGQLSKSGEANSMMGSKQVIKNTLNVANGVKTENSINTGSTVIEERALAYKDLTAPSKPAFTPKHQKIETHYDKTINSPTRHLKTGQKILVAQQLAQAKGNLQSDRDAIKKISSMQQSVGQG